MKSFLLPVMGLILGVAAGCIWHWVVTGGKKENFVPYRMSGAQTKSAEVKDDSKNGRPRVLVTNGEIYDVGTIETNRNYEHDFIISNQGDAPLKIKLLKTSRNCDLTGIEDGQEVSVEPGSTYPVSLKWIARKLEPKFRQYAEIETNDKNKPKIDLIVEGSITPVTQSIPSEQDLGTINANETRQFEFVAITNRHESMEIVGYEFVDPSSAKYFDVTYEKMTSAQLKDHQDAKCGFRVTVNLKAGLPVGLFEQDLHLKTNLPDHKTIGFTIKARSVAK